MTTPIETPDCRLPLRVIKVNGLYEVWTAQDDRPGSLNNYMVAGDIQREDEAVLFAAAPQMLEALKAVHSTYRTFRNVPKDEQDWGPLDDEAIAAIESAIERVQPGYFQAKETSQ